MVAVKRTLAAILILFALTVPVRATDWYFSDCGWRPDNPAIPASWAYSFVGSPADPRCHNCTATDCGICDEGVLFGTEGQVPGKPYCLDAAHFGVKQSFEYILGGGDFNASPGDTIHLCAGRCDGQGSATYFLEMRHTNVGSESCPIATGCSAFEYTFDGGGLTIEPYCTSAGACDTVALNGDTNANNVYDPGCEATHLVNSASCSGGVLVGHGGYIWLGDPTGSGTKHIILEKSLTALVYEQQIPPGASNVYDSLELRYQGNADSGAGAGYGSMFRCTGSDCDNLGSLDGVGSTVGLNSAGCGTQTDSGAFIVTRERGTFTARNGKYHHLCFAALRNNNNCNGTQTTGCTDGAEGIIFTDNEIWNAVATMNSHQFRNATIARNYAHDTFYGIGVEEQVVDSTIEDNRVACLGQYDVNIQGAESVKCAVGIEVNDGDNPPSDGCADSGGASGVCTTKNITVQRNRVWQDLTGHMVTGITFSAHNTSSDLGTSKVENNMIYGIAPSQDCVAGDSHTSLSILSTDPVSVRNNTVLRSKCPVNLAGASHTFSGNAVEVGTNAELYVAASALSSTITNNNLYDSAGTIATINAANYTCAQIPTIQTGNVCGPDTFVSALDPHLDPLSGTCTSLDAAATGAAMDFDKQLRPFGTGATPYDIGADEWFPNNFTLPIPAIDAPPPGG